MANVNENIQKILSSKTLGIKALTSAGIISGVVTDIESSSSNSEKKSNILDDIMSCLSKNANATINIEQNNLTYTIENAKLYPISNLKENIFLDTIELNASKIIALCPLFEEVD